MLLVLSEEHKEHLGFLHDVDSSGKLINHFCLQLIKLRILRYSSSQPINDNMHGIIIKSREKRNVEGFAICRTKLCGYVIRLALKSLTVRQNVKS